MLVTGKDLLVNTRTERERLPLERPSRFTLTSVMSLSLTYHAVAILLLNRIGLELHSPERSQYAWSS